MKKNPNLNILVVDDDIDIRNFISTILRKNGFTNIHEEVDGLGAVDFLEQSFLDRKNVDMVLADWQMPEIDGIRLLDYLKRNPDFSDIPFLMVTSDSDRYHIVEAINHGVSQYLIKPFDEKKLLTKIDKALRLRRV